MEAGCESNAIGTADVMDEVIEKGVQRRARRLNARQNGLKLLERGSDGRTSKMMLDPIKLLIVFVVL